MLTAVGIVGIFGADQSTAGTVVFKLYDTTLHAKGGLPDEGFFRTADACILFYDTTKESRCVQRLVKG